MAKELKEIKEVKEVSEKFYLSDNIKREGCYVSVIDGKKFTVDFERNFRGDITSQYASADGKDYFENLTNEQFRILALAKIIKLSETQAKKFRELFY